MANCCGYSKKCKSYRIQSGSLCQTPLGNTNVQGSLCLYHSGFLLYCHFLLDNKIPPCICHCIYHLLILSYHHTYRQGILFGLRQLRLVNLEICGELCGERRPTEQKKRRDRCGESEREIQERNTREKDREGGECEGRVEEGGETYPGQ